VGNSGQVSFAVLLRATEARRIPQDPETVLLDGVLIEVQMTTAAWVSAPSARGSELLRAHQKASIAVMSKKMGWPSVLVGSTPGFSPRPDLEVLAWHFKVPGPLKILGQEIAYVGNVSVAIDDAVFALSVPFRKQEDPEVALEKIRDILRSIKRLDRPVDPDAFARDLLANPNLWPDCRDRN